MKKGNDFTLFAIIIVSILFGFSSFLLIFQIIDNHRPVYFLGLVLLALIYLRSRGDDKEKSE